MLEIEDYILHNFSDYTNVARNRGICKRNR